jgi:hypothetical protein
MAMNLKSFTFVTHPLPLAILTMLCIGGLTIGEAFSDIRPWNVPVVSGVRVTPTGTLKSGMTVEVYCDFIGVEKPIDTNKPDGKYISQQTWWIPIGVLEDGKLINDPSHDKEPAISSPTNTASSGPYKYTLPQYGNANAKTITFTCIADYNDPNKYFYSAKSRNVPLISTHWPITVPKKLILPQIKGSAQSGSPSSGTVSAPVQRAPVMQLNTRHIEPMQR